MAEKKHNDVMEDLRNQSDEELVISLANERRKMYEMKARHVTKQLDNTVVIPQTRKQIARILTIQRERTGR